jgi:hypothetical protein
MRDYCRDDRGGIGIVAEKGSQFRANHGAMASGATHIPEYRTWAKTAFALIHFSVIMPVRQ